MRGSIRENSSGAWRRTLTVGLEGFASGLPLMSISSLLQGWLTSSGIPVGMVGLLGLSELPYTLKLFWAPLMDRWAIPWPDRRRGWMALLQLLIGLALLGFTFLHPGPAPSDLLLIGLAAILVAVLSASQDVVLDAYRTDLLPSAERGVGAAAATLGYRGAMLFIGAGGFFIAGQFGWRIAFLTAAVLML
ncbi:MAG TPA: MFS transporter, partial [Prochlorococcus sp.]